MVPQALILSIMAPMLACKLALSELNKVGMMSGGAVSQVAMSI